MICFTNASCGSFDQWFPTWSHAYNPAPFILFVKISTRMIHYKCLNERMNMKWWPLTN